MMNDYDEYAEHPQRITYDGKRMRTKLINRKVTDYNSGVVSYVKDRVYARDQRDMPSVMPTGFSQERFMCPLGYLSNPASSITSKFVHTSTNKQRCPVNCVVWTPEGRRLITGCSTGEFTLWNGLAFNFETILQAHSGAVRSMVWSHNGDYMVTGDHGGEIMYWKPNMANLQKFRAHNEAIRDISFCRTDQKFATCSDDCTIKIWDFAMCHEEATLTGHGWDVRCLAWHPHNSLIVSGSKDNDVKLWDAKSAQRIATLHGHKNAVLDVEWNNNGNWLLTASRDQQIKLYDIRTMREIQTFKGHKKEACSLAWHPIHEEFFVSGGTDGVINFWNCNDSLSMYEIQGAHDNSVWSLAWHPNGHILASGSNDHCTKFWSRQSPGDKMDPRYHIPAAYNNHYDPNAIEDTSQQQQQLQQQFGYHNQQQNPKHADLAIKAPALANHMVTPGFVGAKKKYSDIPGLGKPKNIEQNQPMMMTYEQQQQNQQAMYAMSEQLQNEDKAYAEQFQNEEMYDPNNDDEDDGENDNEIKVELQQQQEEEELTPSQTIDLKGEQEMGVD